MAQIGEFLPFLLVLVVFWFLIIRPQRRRQAQMQSLQRTAQPGARVVLTSGIMATLVENSDDKTLVEIADGVVIQIARAAIGHVLPEDIDGTDGTDDTDEATATSTGEEK